MKHEGDMMMDAKRAREIAASPVMKNVTLDGTPVYIESIPDDNATAWVHPLNQPGNRRRVNLMNLIEQ
jgi:small acid-soluble spore protein H (minor)